jgi:hypothetical protein
MSIKSILKPENSAIAGVAVAGSVMAIYSLDVGTVASAHASDSNHSALEASRKKAGYTALIFCAGIALITRDMNIAILGGATIIGMEIHYRHAIMVNPQTNKVEPPNPSAYQPAGSSNVIPLTSAQPTQYDDDDAYSA